MEVEFELPIQLKAKFKAHPAEMATLHCPGGLAYLEDIRLYLLTKSGKYIQVPMGVEHEILDMYEDEIEEVCWDRAKDEGEKR